MHSSLKKDAAEAEAGVDRLGLKTRLHETTMDAMAVSLLYAIYYILYI
jgi:hypothetical protein